MNSTEDNSQGFPVGRVVCISLLIAVAVLYQVFVPDHNQGAWLLGLGEAVGGGNGHRLADCLSQLARYERHQVELSG